MYTIEKKNSKASIVKMIGLATVVGLAGLMSSCSKENGMSHLSVRMTDAPANYDAVLIDLQDVEITGSGGATVMLNTTDGIYNLLDFSNGLSTLIATGDLEAGTVSQIRLILGTNNSVVVDGVSHPMATPSSHESGLKIQIHHTFEPGVSYVLLLDFDANQSVALQGNGDYHLHPVIRTVDVAINGSIRGSITPVGTVAVVTATSGLVSYSSIVNAGGEFLIAGLPAGTFAVTVSPVLPLLPVTVTDIVVTVGVSTNIGVVAL